MMNEWIGKGKEYLAQKDYRKSIDAFTKAIEEGENTPEIYLSRGIAYFMVADYERAKADFTQAIELNPDYFRAYHSRGLVFFNLKQYWKALADFDKATKLNPKYGAAYLAKAKIYMALGKEEKVDENLKMLIRIAEARCQTSCNVYDSRTIEEKVQELKQSLRKN